MYHNIVPLNIYQRQLENYNSCHSVNKFFFSFVITFVYVIFLYILLKNDLYIIYKMPMPNTYTLTYVLNKIYKIITIPTSIEYGIY